MTEQGKEEELGIELVGQQIVAVGKSEQSLKSRKTSQLFGNQLAVDGSVKSTPGMSELDQPRFKVVLGGRFFTRQSHSGVFRLKHTLIKITEALLIKS